MAVLDTVSWGGATNIWFVYNDPLGDDSGPEGYGYTESDPAFDMLKAFITLYHRRIGIDPNYTAIDWDVATSYYDTHSGDAWVWSYQYPYAAPAMWEFRAVTLHTAKDTGLGVYDEFDTEDSF